MGTSATHENWRAAVHYIVSVQIGMELSRAAGNFNQTMCGDGTMKDHTDIQSFLITSANCDIIGIP